MARYTKSGKKLTGIAQAFHWLGSTLFGTDALNEMIGNVESFANKTTGAGLTGADREKASLEDAIADENATVAYQRQRELQEDYGPAWQIEQQAQGYKNVGLNLMSLAGTQPSVTASTPTPSSGGSPDSSNGDPSSFVSLLGNIFSLAMKRKDLDIRKSVADADVEFKKSQTAFQNIQNAWADKNAAIDYENKVYNSRLTQANIRKLSADAQNAEIQALYAPDLFQSQIDVANSNVALASSNIDKNVSEISVNEVRVKEINALTVKHKKEFAQIDALTAKIREEYNLLIKQEALTDVQIREGEKRIEKYDADIRLIGKQIGLAEKDIQYYIMNHVKVLDVSDVDKAGLSISYIDPETGAVVKDGAGIMPKTKVQIPH